MKKKTTRRSAGTNGQLPTVSNLLEGAEVPTGGQSRGWVTMLSTEQQRLCHDARAACHADRGLNRTRVAKNIIQQLGLRVKVDAVRKWLSTQE